MIEICPQLYVGNQDDYEYDVKSRESWAVVHACKYPYHRDELGYTSRSAPKHHPEYLIARRGNRLILNLIDPDSPKYIPHEIIDAAIQFVAEKLGEGRKVLVHCNQGMSRSPGIGLLYLVSHTDLLPKTSLENAECAFRKIYSLYEPRAGIRGHMHENWSTYAGARDGAVG